MNRKNLKCRKIFRLAGDKNYPNEPLVYLRGGKVWTGKNGEGLVFLEKDWMGSRLPEDLVEEAGLLGTDFHLLDKKQRARLAGYAIYANIVEFTADPFAAVPDVENQPEWFVACDFNNWLQNGKYDKKWQLIPDEEGYLVCSVNLNLLPIKDHFSFKFKSSFNQWYGPPDFFPSQEELVPGAANFVFDLRRTGDDIFSFRLIEEDNSIPVRKWLSLRPENLGYSKNGNTRTFRLFAPRVERVVLHLLNQAKSPSMAVTYSMSLGEDGVWETIIDKSVEYLYYHYEVIHKNGHPESKPFTKWVLDPYAKGCTGREGPGILTCNATNSGSNFVNSFITPEPQDLVIMEGHIRDLLKYAPFELSESERRGFRGLAKWLKSEDCYLRKMGVNAVELQPVYQFDSRSKSEYHWGYMPVNFFSPASDYASNPEIASKECKELFSAFHEANLAVILDVVYNHVGIPNHLLNLDRELYLSTDELGRLTNYSGCGNDLYCNAEPVKKMIIDSLKYWVLNYQVDGFRFDLAELLGIELLAEIEFELRKLNPKIILIAEPWSFRGRLPEKMNQTGYSLWSDRCRESLLSFVREGKDMRKIYALLQGKLDPENFYPWQSLQYIESHDDFAFIDRLCSDCESGGMYPDESATSQATLAMIILLLSPGIPMITAGQDFLRSKRGIRNTYQNGDVNALDYHRLKKYQNVNKAVCEVIEFRQSKRGLFTRPKTFNLCDYSENELQTRDIFNLTIRHKQEREEFLFLCNPHPCDSEMALPLGWENQQTIIPNPPISNSKAKLRPYEYRLLGRKNC